MITFVNTLLSRQEHTAFLLLNAPFLFVFCADLRFLQFIYCSTKMIQLEFVFQLEKQKQNK